MQPSKTENQPASSQRGLVVSYFGNSVAVLADNGQVFPCHLKRNQTLPVVGDWVRWTPDKQETGVVESIEPRRSLLARGDGKGEMKPLAANIDLMLIVMAPPPILSEYLLDRYLVAAALLSLPVIVVLNKSDLLDEVTKNAVLERFQPYTAIPYEILFTSIYDAESMTALSARLVGQSAVLVGPSGVGKSSIIARLAGEAIRIGDVSSRGAGKHTTTATRLYPLPTGGSLIDSPGVREFTLWPVTAEEIWCGFREFQLHATGCRFRDCHHLAEPGCAVQQAIKDGKISQQRYNNYLELLKHAKKVTYPKK